jgi:hypothetical protein
MQSNKIDLTWSGATDSQGIAGYELYYCLGPIFGSWISIPFISTTSGGGTYSHTITTFVDHKFAIRTMDTAGQYSIYKYLTVPISPQILISDGYDSSIGVCKRTSTNPILLTAPPSAYVSVIKNIDNSIFDGGDKYWRLVYPYFSSIDDSVNTLYYNCKVNSDGLIVEIIPCDIQTIVNSLNISQGYSTNSILCSSSPTANPTNKYYTGELVVGTILYTTYIDGSLSSPYDGYDKFYYVVSGSSNFVIKIGTGTNIGKVLSLSSYSTACPVTSGGGGTGGGGGGGCPDPETLISMVGGIKVKAGNVKVGDFVYTMHEITGEFGEFEVIGAELVEQEKLLIIFDDDSEIKISDSHKFLMYNKQWLQAYKLVIGDIIKGIEVNKIVKSIEKIGIGSVIKFEINDAHTYVSAGLISHNTKQELAIQQ